MLFFFKDIYDDEYYETTENEKPVFDVEEDYGILLLYLALCCLYRCLLLMFRIWCLHSNN